MLLSVFFLPDVFADYCQNKPAGISITAPKEIEALSGSCLEIPCSFNTSKPIDSSGNIIGVWMKNNLAFSSDSNVVIFNSSRSVNKYPLNITGNLTEKNCTTLFPDLNTSYTDKYFFRVENGPFRATACADPLQINVKGSLSPNVQLHHRLSAPEKIEALTGSCLQIPCSFNTKHKRFDSRRTVYGVWMKKSLKFSLNQNVVIFNSSESVNTYPLKMIGNLGEKNCTTLFPYLNTSYTDKYFFRVENGQFRATACAKPLQITVEDSPRSPSINVPSDLKEHQSVTLTCSAFTPCPHSPPQLTCNLQQDSVGKTEKNTDGTFTTKIQENITLSDTHDGYNITCSARYPVIGGSKTAGTEMTLSVSCVSFSSDAPKNTSASISPSGLVSAGSWVELSCSSRAKPPPRFTWFRISKHGDINVSVGPVYGFNFTKRGEYYCAATNDLGNQ
uniref:Ig-like domain-containing protein n=1 Tax=Poecilia formosa TaxID=48698 RepID=A0A096M8W2_POEFO